MRLLAINCTHTLKGVANKTQDKAVSTSMHKLAPKTVTTGLTKDYNILIILMF
jgi:hypothetical protein